MHEITLTDTEMRTVRAALVALAGRIRDRDLDNGQVWSNGADYADDLADKFIQPIAF
jgi:hypothetical protein